MRVVSRRREVYGRGSLSAEERREARKIGSIGDYPTVALALCGVPLAVVKAR